MKTAELQVLLVAEDSELIVNLSQELMIGLSANLTISDNVEQAASLAVTDGFDVIIACQRLRTGSGIALLSTLANKEISSAVILIDECLDPHFILSALRLGAADVFNTPVDGSRLIASIQSAVQRRREQMQLVARTRRLRRLSSRLVKDRRDLRNRVDVVCRDVVTAYRRLAEKVVASQPASGEHPIDLDSE
jgi:DNA-binding NtrC family response regulator